MNEPQRAWLLAEIVKRGADLFDATRPGRHQLVSLGRVDVPDGDVVYTQAPAAVVAMNLKNSHATFEVSRLREELRISRIEKAEVEQELLEEKDAHTETWQIAQKVIQREVRARRLDRLIICALFVQVIWMWLVKWIESGVLS